MVHGTSVVELLIKGVSIAGELNVNVDAEDRPRDEGQKRMLQEDLLSVEPWRRKTRWVMKITFRFMRRLKAVDTIGNYSTKLLA